MMKRLSSVIIVLLAFTAAWADSPLTSTYFAGAYEDHPMVQLIDEGMDGDIPSVVLEFLADKKSPVDVRLAVINKIGWFFAGSWIGGQLGDYLMDRYKANSKENLVKKLDAGTLAVYAYAQAMSDYLEVDEAKELGHLAVKKNKGKSLSVALISALIDAQDYLHTENGWPKIYPALANVLNDGSLKPDMRQEAIDCIMEYINLYEKYK